MSDGIDKLQKSDIRKYNASIKKIKKNFVGIILNVVELPDIGNNKVILVNDLDELADMSDRIKKSIYYIEKDYCCDFILINDDTYYVYTLKANDELKSLFERENCRFKIQSKDQSELLDDIESTAIIKIENGKCFKVSPIVDTD